MCAYTNGTYNNFNEQCIPAYEELPYYNGEPIILDYWWGLEKVARKGQHPGTYVDMPFYPFDRPVSTDAMGSISEPTLDAAVNGAFFWNVIGDTFVILMVMLHMHLLKMRGVWGIRGDEVDAYEGDGVDDGEAGVGSEGSGTKYENKERISEGDASQVDVTLIANNSFRPITVDTGLGAQHISFR